MNRTEDRVRALVVPANDELGRFVAGIRQGGIDVRAFEESGRVVLETRDEPSAELVRRLHGAWLRGERGWLNAIPRVSGSRGQGAGFGAALRELARYPAVLLTIVTAVILYPMLGDIGAGEPSGVALLLLIVDAGRGVDVSLSRLAAEQEYWRWFAPVFVHFSWMHVAFNCAAVYEFGRRVEAANGALVFLLLLLLIGTVANLAQVAAGVSPLFGGLSGVAYGLAGYVLVRGRMDRRNPYWRIHPAIPGSLLVVLAVFSTGVTSWFGLNIANAAHWGGLITGGALALVAGSARRMRT